MHILPKHARLLPALGMLLMLAACKPEPVIEDREGVFELVFVPQAGTEAFQANTTHQNAEGRSYALEGLKMYVGDLTLIQENGDELLLTETFLYDFVRDAGSSSLSGGVGGSFDVPAGTYRGIRFGIGVPADLNNGNPAVYASDHPLSISNGMHWNWTTGYIFLKVDGRIDSTAAMTGGPVLGMTYHTGTNELYRELSYTEAEHAFEIKEGERLAFAFSLDINRLFYTDTDTLDMVTNNLTHTTPVGSDAFQLAEYITDNLVEGALTKLPF
ncbi:MAG: hypothetical protein D6722_23375 [Bacteroidetes bacterium]|nr:MAG: hypothetical protein D6722_23375 [Bacteroidota bacterium]